MKAFTNCVPSCLKFFFIKDSNRLVKKLIGDGIIDKKEDLTANEKTNIIFDYMLNKYSFLLYNDINTVLPKSYFTRGLAFHKLLFKIGKYFLNSPQIFENRKQLLVNDTETFKDRRSDFEKPVKYPDEPVIFVMNHRFKDDVLASLLSSERRMFILFGSIPQFFGSLDGIIAVHNGVVMVNRKSERSRKSSVAKAKNVLENGMSLLICPEGVWNKTPNNLLLDFWSGFYKIAKKNDGSFYPIVPIVHYISDTYEKGKNNPIHTIIDEPINIDGLGEKDAVSKVRDIMATWYWKLMETYGKSKHSELLGTYNCSADAWENELKRRRLTVDKYDYEIETSADRRRKDEPLTVWSQIADLNITRNNMIEVISARRMLKELKLNDFQHRF